MCLDLSVSSNHKGHISEVFILKHAQQILGHLWLRNLNSNGEHPNIIETEFTVVASKNVELAFHDIGCVSASWAWLELTCGHLLPVITFDIENMYVIHPMDAIIASKVYYLGVNKAPCC